MGAVLAARSSFYITFSLTRQIWNIQTSLWEMTIMHTCKRTFVMGFFYEGHWLTLMFDLIFQLPRSLAIEAKRDMASQQ
jgi:hypothetical protein